MAPWSKLSNARKIQILERAASMMHEQTNGDCVRGTYPSVRMAIVRAMNEQGYWNMGIGGKREISVTSEIGKANSMDPAPEVVADWGNHNPIRTVLAGIVNTIRMLERHANA